MNVKVIFGGSGKISTQKLEKVEAIIIRARTAHNTLTVDSNFLMSLINETLKHRKQNITNSSFKLTSAIFDPSSELDVDDNSSDSKVIEVDELILDEYAPEEPEIKIKVPKRKKISARGKVKSHAKQYWLASPDARIAVTIGLLALISIIVFGAIYL